jgi:hypothetical protein
LEHLILWAKIFVIPVRRAGLKKKCVDNFGGGKTD